MFFNFFSQEERELMTRRIEFSEAFEKALCSLDEKDQEKMRTIIEKIEESDDKRDAIDVSDTNNTDDEKNSMKATDETKNSIKDTGKEIDTDTDTEVDDIDNNTCITDRDTDSDIECDDDNDLYDSCKKLHMIALSDKIAMMIITISYEERKNNNDNTQYVMVKEFIDLLDQLSPEMRRDMVSLINKLVVNERNGFGRKRRNEAMKELHDQLEAIHNMPQHVYYPNITTFSDYVSEIENPKTDLAQQNDITYNRILKQYNDFWKIIHKLDTDNYNKVKGIISKLSSPTQDKLSATIIEIANNPTTDSNYAERLTSAMDDVEESLQKEILMMFNNLIIKKDN